MNTCETGAPLGKLYSAVCEQGTLARTYVSYYALVYLNDYAWLEGRGDLAKCVHYTAS